MLPPARLTPHTHMPLLSGVSPSHFLESCLEYRSSRRPLLFSDAPMSSCTILTDITILAILLRETKIVVVHIVSQNFKMLKGAFTIRAQNSVDT